MTRSALHHRVYLEDPQQNIAETPVHLTKADKLPRQIQQQLTVTVLLVGFILALCYIAHADFCARAAIRRHELQGQLAQLQRESRRLEVRLEYLTSHGQVLARARAMGYDYPDSVHEHTEQVARLPWEAVARPNAAGSHQSVFAAVWHGLTSTFQKVAQRPGTTVAFAGR